jgi:hypothetical protein
MGPAVAVHPRYSIGCPVRSIPSAVAGGDVLALSIGSKNTYVVVSVLISALNFRVLKVRVRSLDLPTLKRRHAGGGWDTHKSHSYTLPLN